MSTLAQRRQARETYKRVVQRSQPGQGVRFRALVKSIQMSGARNPEAIAAAIGRRKYGTQQMTRWAVAARKRRIRRK